MEPGLRAACHRQKDAGSVTPHLPEVNSEDCMSKAETPALVVFSGGTAFNSIAGQTTNICMAL